MKSFISYVQCLMPRCFFPSTAAFPKQWAPAPDPERKKGRGPSQDRERPKSPARGRESSVGPGHVSENGRGGGGVGQRSTAGNAADPDRPHSNGYLSAFSWLSFPIVFDLPICTFEYFQVRYTFALQLCPLQCSNQSLDFFLFLC